LNPRPYLREIGLKREKIADFNQYPFVIPAVRKLEILTFHPDVTFLVGENGIGKSTLLEAIAVALGFNPEGGSKNFRFNTRASHAELFRYLKIVRSFRRPRDGYFLRAESFFNVATEIERLDEGPNASSDDSIIKAYGGLSLHEQSHGESFWSLVLHRFRGHGLYILDEPEAALSPKRQLLMLRRIHELVEKESQFIISTHSPLLLAYPRAKIVALDERGFRETGYEQTDPYRITREFLNEPRKMLDRLLTGDALQDGLFDA